MFPRSSPEQQKHCSGVAGPFIVLRVFPKVFLASDSQSESTLSRFRDNGQGSRQSEKCFSSFWTK